MAVWNKNSNNFNNPSSLKRRTYKRRFNNNRNFLFVYMSVMFAAALILILLSYFISSRNNAAIDAMDKNHAAFSAGGIQGTESLFKNNAASREENENFTELAEAQIAGTGGLNA